MRLADFIQAHVEPILVEFEAFARTIWPDGAASPNASDARNDAKQILHATVADMRGVQTAAQQTAKSHGGNRATEQRGALGRPSLQHGEARAVSGFDLWALTAEYRALRASVLRLWRDSNPAPDLLDLDDLTRFNESMDQSLTVAVHAYGVHVDREREELLASERAARDSAEAANRAKDVFLAILSHEMRTPLNAIVGWLSILQHADVAAEQTQEGLKVIARNTRAQVQLIDDLLDVSRILSGNLRVALQPCELSEVIAAGVDVMRAAAEARGITVSTSVDPEASSTSCDGPRMQQVVWNLLSNAVKFTPKGGRVDVSLSRHASSLRIEVRDNGRGISADMLPHVFDRFRQPDSTTRRSVGGLGLGLSIVKYIVEAHGGTIDAQSPGEGAGATFIVSLPIQAVRSVEGPRESGDMASRAAESAPHAPAHDPIHLPATRLDGVRVLVVDDEADSRRALVMVLEQAGALVVPAGSVDGALAALAVVPPDVLVSDLGMPEQDGFDLIRQVRDQGRDAGALPAIALTALVQKEDAERALAAGFQVHVPKPVDPHRLTAVIATLTVRND